MSWMTLFYSGQQEVSNDQYFLFQSSVDTNRDVIKSFITRLFNFEAGQTA